MGLIARTIESAGIATIALSHMDEMNRRLGVPRSVVTKIQTMGFPLGSPNCAEQHDRNLLTCLSAGYALGPGEVVTVTLEA